MPIQWPLDYSFQAGFVGNLYHHLVACKQICIPDTVVIRNHRLVGWWETVATAGGSQNAPNTATGKGLAGAVKRRDRGGDRSRSKGASSPDLELRPDNREAARTTALAAGRSRSTPLARRARKEPALARRPDGSPPESVGKRRRRQQHQQQQQQRQRQRQQARGGERPLRGSGALALGAEGCMVERRPDEDLTPEAVYRAFTTTAHQFGAGASLPGRSGVSLGHQAAGGAGADLIRGIVAYLITTEEDSHGLPFTHCEYLDRDGLSRLLYGTLPTSGLLQRFVPPRGAVNSTLRVTWTPSRCTIDQRDSVHKLNDSRIPMERRGATFEGDTFNSTPVVFRSRMHTKRLRAICEVLAGHIKQRSPQRYRIHSMVLNFKADARDNLFLLYASSIDVDSKLGKIALPDNIWSTAMSMRSEARQTLGGSGAGGHGGGGHNLRSSGRSAGYGVGGASEGVVGGSSRIAGRNKFKKSSYTKCSYCARDVRRAHMYDDSLAALVRDSSHRRKSAAGGGHPGSGSRSRPRLQRGGWAGGSLSSSLRASPGHVAKVARRRKQGATAAAGVPAFLARLEPDLTPASFRARMQDPSYAQRAMPVCLECCLAANDSSLNHLGEVVYTTPLLTTDSDRENKYADRVAAEAAAHRLTLDGSRGGLGDVDVLPGDTGSGTSAAHLDIFGNTHVPAEHLTESMRATVSAHHRAAVAARRKPRINHGHRRNHPAGVPAAPAGVADGWHGLPGSDLEADRPMSTAAARRRRRAAAAAAAKARLPIATASDKSGPEGGPDNTNDHVGDGDDDDDDDGDDDDEFALEVEDLLGDLPPRRSMPGLAATAPVAGGMRNPRARRRSIAHLNTVNLYHTNRDTRAIARDLLRDSGDDGRPGGGAGPGTSGAAVALSPMMFARLKIKSHRAKERASAAASAGRR